MANWVTDAQFFKDAPDNSLLVSNAKIRRFLEDNHDTFIIVASKGMGKTLLLRKKKEDIDKNYKGVINIPHNEVADFVNLPPSIPKELEKSLKDEVFWEDIWKISISVSIIAHFQPKLTPDERVSAKQLVNQMCFDRDLEAILVESVSNRYVQYLKPSDILSRILQLGKRKIEIIRAHAIVPLRSLLAMCISSASFVFIDSFDQALHRAYPDNLEIWSAAQCGLMRASWEMSRHARHIKVYITIRQEAFASFKGSEKTNMAGNILVIEYSDDDLRSILEKAIQYYEHIQDISTFVGSEKIYNGYLRTNEEAFSYISRHTIGVPRWLLTIGSEIASSRDRIKFMNRSEYQKLLSNLINRKSTELAKDYIENEMNIFFAGQRPESFINKFIEKISSSILTYRNLEMITRRAISSEGWDGTNHPFCLLYNIGLIGIVKSASNSNGRLQYFKRPYEFDWEYKNIIPTDERTIFLVHPCVHGLIQEKSNNFKFNKIRICDRAKWTKIDDNRLAKENIRIFISYSHKDGIFVDQFATELDDQLCSGAIIHDIWYDKWSMRGGRWIQDQIRDGVVGADYLILILSKNSVGSSSVATEWKTKFAKKLSDNVDSILPVRIDNVPDSDVDEFIRNMYIYKCEDVLITVKRIIDDILYYEYET